MVRPVLSSLLVIFFLSGGVALATPAKDQRYLYGCRFVGHGAEGDQELFNFPLSAPSVGKPRAEKVAESSRKTTLTITLTLDGKLALAYVDNIYRLNLFHSVGAIPGVNPGKGQFGKIEKTFATPKKHSFPFTKYSLNCE